MYLICIRCGHCKNLAPEWKKAAALLDGKAKLGAVDATVESALAAKYEIQSYPTIKYFPRGEKVDAQAYTGGRAANDFVKFAAQKGGFEVPAEKGTKAELVAGEVTVLTKASFKDTVLESKDLWLVEFYAPWYEHCSVAV
jgi:protein disulfide-isomerase A6